MAYVTEYGKTYGTKAEFEFRGSLFKENLALIEESNANEENTHVLAVNHMSDWTESEYKKLLGYKPEMRLGAREPTILDTTNLADDIDWE
jgi:C1A family cysteine protease